ncbi:MAG: hypothetical protein KJ064_06190 [Anaerolineae bacterium]|nr:hypothetical protein [Anaerolineae bacterium]
MQHIEKCRMTDLWSLDTPLPIEVMRYEVPHIPLYGTCRGKLLGLLHFCPSAAVFFSKMWGKNVGTPTAFGVAHAAHPEVVLVR